MENNRENRDKVGDRMKNSRKKRKNGSLKTELYVKVTKICKNTFCKQEFKTDQNYRFCDSCRHRINSISSSMLGGAHV